MAVHPGDFRRSEHVSRARAPARVTTDLAQPGRATRDGSSAATLDDVVALLQEILERLDGRAAPAVPKPPPVLRAVEPEILTARQIEILGMVADGLSTEAIAQRLWLSVATVRNHIARSLRALDARSRIQAVARARQLGLLP